MNKKHVSILLCLLAFHIYGQNDTLVISLDECINLSRTQSPSFRSLYLEQSAREREHRADIAGYLPRLSLKGSAPSYNFNSSDSGREGSESVGASATLSLLQQVPFTNTTIELGSSLATSKTTPANNIDPLTAEPVTLTLRQPLNIYNTQWRELKRQNLEYTLQERKYLQSIEKITGEACAAFFRYYIAQRLFEAAVVNAAINDTIVALAKGRFGVGRIAENDLLESEYAAMSARLNVESSRLECDRAEQTLKNFLGLEVRQNVVLPDVPPISGDTLSADSAIVWAHRYGTAEIDWALRMHGSESAVMQALSRAMPTLELTGSIGYRSSGTTMSDVMQLSQHNTAAAIGINADLFDWGAARNKSVAARLKNKSLEVTMERERRDFESNLRLQVKEFMLIYTEIAMAAKNDTIATRRFEVAKNRYMIGKIDISDMRAAQQEKERAQSKYLETLRRFWTTFFDLRGQVLFDWEKKMPIKRV